MMDPAYDQVIEEVADRLQSSHRILFITGAGISADSGLPTYRGVGGLYDIELTEDGLPIEVILSGPTYRENPRLTWKYLGHMLDAAKNATFNRAHEVIASMEAQWPEVWTLTQNVDGYHHLAGSKNIVEIHGSMRKLSCLDCDRVWQVDESTSIEIPPLCQSCGCILRPGVVLFEEALPDQALRLYEQLMATTFDIIFSIGTSALFPYIQAPIWEAAHCGITTVEINPQESELSRIVTYRIPARAAESLDAIWNALTRPMN